MIFGVVFVTGVGADDGSDADGDSAEDADDGNDSDDDVDGATRSHALDTGSPVPFAMVPPGAGAQLLPNSIIVPRPSGKLKTLAAA